MKRIFVWMLCIASAAAVHAAKFETATEAARHMGLGWNLGNTLDANNGRRQDLSSETCWGQAYATPELMVMMKKAGFGAVRVPVTWYNHMDGDGRVDEAWMRRVHQVVDYVLDAGLYCIVNVHHDTGAARSAWLIADEDSLNACRARYEHLWEQIADEFRDYGQKLLFESYNEMLDRHRSWCFASYNAPERYDAAVAASAYRAINGYAQSFVDVVRRSGGKNATRNIIVNTYGGCSGSGSWNPHLKEPLTRMEIPRGERDHLLIQVHTYINIERGFERARAEANDMLEALQTNFVDRGFPVVIGEWGTSNVDSGSDYRNRRDILLQYAAYFVEACKRRNMPTFYWRGLSDGRAARSVPCFNEPDVAQTLVKAFHGAKFKGKFPTAK